MKCPFCHCTVHPMDDDNIEHKCGRCKRTLYHLGKGKLVVWKVFKERMLRVFKEVECGRR